MGNEEFTVEISEQADGTFVASVPEFPGVIAQGNTREEAEQNARLLLQDMQTLL